MTIKTIDEIQAALSENSHALSQASADAAMYARLKAAAGEEARLCKEGEALARQLSQAIDAQMKAARSAFAKTVRNLRITVRDLDRGAMARCTVEWEGLEFNSRLGESEVIKKSRDGFETLPPDIYTYILTECPERIPAHIMGFCPEDAATAVSLYLTAQRRGWA